MIKKLLVMMIFFTSGIITIPSVHAEENAKDFVKIAWGEGGCGTRGRPQFLINDHSEKTINVELLLTRKGLGKADNKKIMKRTVTPKQKLRLGCNLPNNRPRLGGGFRPNHNEAWLWSIRSASFE